MASTATLGANGQETALIRGMRDEYFTALYPYFQNNQRNFFLSADNGAPSMDQFSDLPGQFQQVGISEQHMVAHACGLALEGYKVLCYSIGVFVLRALESIKLNMCAQREQGLPITYVGIGPGFAYSIMGPTHHGVGCYAALRPWPNLSIWLPADSVTAVALAHHFSEHQTPEVIFFDRTDIKAQIYQDRKLKLSDGLAPVKNGKDITIIGSGIMVHQALKVADLLERRLGIQVGVIDLFRLKPINEDLLLDLLAGSSRIVTYEEDYLQGGMGSAIAEILIDHRVQKPTLRLGVPDQFVLDMGGRGVIWKKFGLNPEAAAERIARTFF